MTAITQTAFTKGVTRTPVSASAVAMALPCFMLVMCIPMAISSLPIYFRVPIRISSLPPYHSLLPLTYTIVEDVIAVDGGGLVEFRQAWRYRYESSSVMRKLLRDLGIFWGVSGIIVAAVCITVAWTTGDNIGYGFGFGIPWLWAFTATAVTVWWTKHELKRERAEWDDVDEVYREKLLHLVETQDDRDAFERMMARSSSSLGSRRPYLRVITGA